MTRLVACGGRRRFEAVDLPEHHRDREDLPTRRGHDLLEQHGQVPLAQQARDGVDLPVVGVGGEVGGEAGGRLAPLLGHRGLERVELAAQAAGLGAGLPAASPVGVRPAHVEERADPGRRDPDDGRRQREDGFVGDHRHDPDRHREHREHRADRDAAVVGPEIVVGRVAHVVPASSARSATISVRRKSLGV